MTFEKLLAEAMDDDIDLANRIEEAITDLLAYYGCPDPENEADAMIHEFKEDNQWSHTQTKED